MAKRLLYLYPEEWVGRRARELHTLQTCLGLADAGVDVTLATAGGFEMEQEMEALGRKQKPEHFKMHNLSRQLGMIKSARIFSYYFKKWLKQQASFQAAYVIHLKAARLLRQLSIPYWWEAHEIFAETPTAGTRAEKNLHRLEREALTHARGRIATSKALADALIARYFHGKTDIFFQIVPHGCDPPLVRSEADPAGPLVYAGSIANWKGLNLIIETAIKKKLPLRVVGGTREEIIATIAALGKIRLRPGAGTIHRVGPVEWHERVTPAALAEALRGCRAGISPTLPQTASGRYSLPMKIFEYARCGLPVVTTNLPSLDSLELGSWCRLVPAPEISAWTQALTHPFSSQDGAEALRWAGEHTWQKRGQRLADILGLKS
jgi:glycosyltransferase involved in cell wall biosynthesis